MRYVMLVGYGVRMIYGIGDGGEVEEMPVGSGGEWKGRREAELIEWGRGNGYEVRKGSEVRKLETWREKLRGMVSARGGI